METLYLRVYLAQLRRKLEDDPSHPVADAHGIPFLGVRGMSDGPGDPLHLPGLPIHVRRLQADCSRQGRRRH
jgi:hypothetical protein